MTATGREASGRGDDTPAAPEGPSDGSARVVRAHLDAFTSGDLAALLDGLTEDAVWITGRTVARGRAELAGLFGAAMSRLEPTLTVRSLVADGRRVACELTEELASGGSRRTYAIAGFYEIVGGRIASARIYREGSAEVP